jgi:hypothetical protein
MPIYERDSWREQYFTGVDCPLDVHIPTDDDDAYRLNPRHCWIYNKLLIARSQRIDSGLHDSPPSRYPVFCKPLVNLKGMGVGSGVLHNQRDYKDQCVSGRFWMTLLQGEHLSSDVAVMSGRAVWYRHTRGIPAVGGTFDYWIIQAAAKGELERRVSRWIQRFLPDYTGMLNVETIGGRIIEMHLRFADQWPDLYGAGWLTAMVRLYEREIWKFQGDANIDGYSVVLFGPHDRPNSYPTQVRLAEYRATPDISSLQITFSHERPAAAHSMPPGGVRLAVINSWDFAAAARLRERMAEDFALSHTERKVEHAATKAAVRGNARH